MTAKPATDKPLKVYASPYKSEESTQAREHAAAALLQTPDVATILNNQRCAFEAMSAATENPWKVRHRFPASSWCCTAR